MIRITDDEITDVLTDDAKAFEEALTPADSPLNMPVVENEIGHSPTKKASTSTNETKTDSPGLSTEDISHNQEASKDDPFDFTPKEEDHVPEQDIGSENFSQTVDDDFEQAEEAFEMPKSHAKQAADAILGMADNVIAVGAGFFVKIKKHKEFYDFEEVIQIIDEQNDKNVLRMRLDETDKVLLRPLLMTILRKKAKKLTPEQQMMGVVLSILMKKVQVTIEIKAENNLMTERILDVIREEKGYSDLDEKDETEDDEAIITPEESVVETPVTATPTQEEVEEQTIEDITILDAELIPANNGLSQVIEVAQDH